MEPKRTKRGKWIAGSLAAAFVAVACAVFAWNAAVAPPGGTAPLDPDDSLGGDNLSVPTAASHYEPESAEKFADVMDIRKSDGTEIKLDDVPEGEYTGFIFSLTDVAAADGALAAKLADATQQGIVRNVHGSTYAADSLDALAGIVDADQVAYVEPNYRLYLTEQLEGGAPATGAKASSTAGAVDLLGGTGSNPAPDWPPNDQAYTGGKLFNLDMLRVQGAWEAGLDGDVYVYNGKPVRTLDDGVTADPVKVAIIDTGLFGTGTDDAVKHEDLNYDRITPGRNFIAGTEGNAPDAHGHGTFVAGLIAGQVNNSKGVAGAMPNVTLVPEKVFDTGSASTEDVISAIYHATDTMHVDVINMSLGGEYNEQALEAACDHAVAEGVLVVASAGNDGVSTPNYPAAYDSVVGVASVNSSKVRSSWSQFGKSVFVTAPGESVTSTYKDGADSYYTASGTSFSGPEVAALAAMCKSVYPDIDQDTFKQFLIETSEDLGSSGYDDYYGYGLVDFTAMAQAVLQSQVLPWYNVKFNLEDENHDAIENAIVEVKAAEDISWEASEADADPAFPAGSIAEGTVIEPGAEGVYKVHRGTYSYTVTAPGYYTVTGTFKTYTENQSLNLTMLDAHEVTVRVVDSAGTPVDGAKLSVSSDRAEQPKSVDPDNALSIFDLASGTYSYEASASGYETVGGTFTVQREAKQIEAVLYKADELRSVAFTVKDAEDGHALEAGVGISVEDASGVTVAAQANGSYRLAAGRAYTARASKVGYEDGSLAFTVGNDASQSQTIELTPASNNITFNVLDESGKAITTAVVKVANESGVPVEARPDNPLRFRLVQGEYTYEVTAPGYEPSTGRFKVQTESHTLTVALKAVPHMATFVVTDAATGALVQNAAIKVSKSGMLRAIAPFEDGVWELTPGDYRYTVYREGYSVAQGSFTMAGEDVEVAVALTARDGSEVAYAGGSGTADDPYLIATEEQLRYLASQTEIVRMTNTTASTNVKKDVDGYYQLVDDIELTGGEWMPIGNMESSENYARFSGVFDGGGHTVSGVSINQPERDYQGFFGYCVGATIENLVVEGAVTGHSYVGGIVGGVAYTHSSIYENMNTDPTTITQCGSRVNVTGHYAIGGIVGSSQASDWDINGTWYDPGTASGINISSCFNGGRVSAATGGMFKQNDGAAGGIVGSAQQNVIYDCYNAAPVQSGTIAGGIVGNARNNRISTSYNSGMVAQYATGTGYGGTAGGIVGRSYYNVVNDAFFLEREGNTGTTYYGDSDTASQFSNCSQKGHAEMYRSAEFAALLNENTVTGRVSSSFTIGRDYPMLSWQVVVGALLAPAPHVVEHPASVEARNAYLVGSESTPLVARVDEVPEGGTLTWVWYAGQLADGSDAQALKGATGTGVRATLAPPTTEEARGARYYYCVFTNTVSDTQGAQDVASATTNAAVVYVRSATDAQIPSITELNPTNTQKVNTSLTAKQGSDKELSVTASVADGGELTYQWFRSATGQGSGTAIVGATGPTYDADTTQVLTTYYYVEVTNTTEPGNSSSVKSDWIKLDVTEYTIGDYGDLLEFRSAVNYGANDFSGQIVYLTSNIAIPDGTSWEPIGTPANPFRGTFNGGSGEAGSTPTTIRTHKITGLNIDGDALGNDYLGLFGYCQDASIYDVQVGGTISGAANTCAGLLAGYVGAASGASYIENCSTLPGSSVEGKYQVGGLVGFTGARMLCVANHADVHAYSYVPTDVDKKITSRGSKSVGGVVGVNNYNIVGDAYNTGDVSVDALGPEAGAVCPEYVGGVAGFLGYYAGIASAFDSGKVTVGSLSANAVQDTRSTQGAGAVAGYVASGMVNLHYQEGAYERGTNNSTPYDYADYHSAQFMKTQYFADMMNTGSSSYPTTQFVKSKSGVPHLMWEDDIDDGQGDVVKSAEPWITDVVSDDLPNITKTWSGTYFENGTARPIYVVAESPDGGVLTYVWQKRDAVDGEDTRGDEEGWQDIEGSSGTIAADGDEAGRASYTIDVAQPHAAQYRCVITNTRADATADDSADPMQSVIPAISIEVKPASEGLYLKDGTALSAANSKDNPWVIDTPQRLRTFAALVNSTQAMPGLDDNCFTGQHVVLAGDIDLGGEEFTPIGIYNSLSHATEFKGVFDGRNHAVTGLLVTQTPAANPTGLFSSLYGATVRNLEVAGTVNVAGGWSYGGVCGYAYGSYFKNVVNRVDVTGGANVGGIVGYVGASKIEDCENLGAITGTKPVGGIAGYMWGGSASSAGAGMYNSFNAGRVTSTVESGDLRSGALLGDAGTSGGAATLSNNYYVAGSAASSADSSLEFGGVGAKSATRPDDKEGSFEAVESADSPETAWKLATSGGTAANSGLWGNIARADLSDTSAAVHLVRGDAASALYRISTASESADITVSTEYGVAGSQVKVAWESKAGFSVKKVSWKKAGADDDDAVSLGTGESGNGSFDLPASDVEFSVDAEQDLSYRYLLTSSLKYGTMPAPAAAGSVTLKASSAGDGARAGDTVTAKIAVADGYQLKSVKAEGAFKTPITVTTVDALTYTFVMPAENVEFVVTFEDEGAAAAKQATSLEVTRTALHRYASDSKYKAGNLLYAATSLSGSYYGIVAPLMTYEFEGLSNPALYEQAYSFSDGSTHTFTGMDLAKVIRQFGDEDIPADVPVRIEATDGSTLTVAYGDLTALTYNSYDETGQPLVRGLPVLLAYGCDGRPNTDGALWVVFGQKSAGDDNAAKVLRGVKRICVGDDVNYSQHVWGVYTDIDAICGGTANAKQGQSDLHIRVYKGDATEPAGETVVSLEKIEKLARRDPAHVQGLYSEVAIYEDKTTPTGSGSDYTDYYEGYDLYQILKLAGIPYEPTSRVQFYQSGQNGLENSWETVSVSLGYLAGNGPDGEGDYSGNYATYSGASIYGVHPMVAYGKNGYPLVWYSGSAGVNVYAYNYRGPLIGFLPQNDTEGGQVADWTATACYLALMDVHLPADADYTPVASIADDDDIAAAEKVLALIAALPDKVASDADAKKVRDAQAAYEALSPDARKLVDADANAMKKLSAATSSATAYEKSKSSTPLVVPGAGAGKDASSNASKAGASSNASASSKASMASQATTAKTTATSVKAGQVYTFGKGANKAKYQVLKPASGKKQGTVAYKKAIKAKAKRVIVPATVKIKGKTYKVVRIKKKAFNNMKKLTGVTVGKNVSKIEKSAFFKTPKLAKITVKSKKLSKKASVKAALKGSKAKKLTVKVPKAKRKAYKKSFTKANLKAPRAVMVK